MTVMASAPNALSVPDHARAAALGDVESLTYLYEKFHDPLLRWLERRTMPDRHLAEDVSSATWLRVTDRIASYNDAPRKGFEPWLWAIARNVLADHFRSNKVGREQLCGEMMDHDSIDSGEGPEARAERRAQAHRIEAELRALPAGQRAVMILRHHDGCDLATTAELLGKSINTVKQLQFRAARTLRKRLGEAAEGWMGATPKPVVAAPAASSIPPPTFPAISDRTTGGTT